MARALGKRARAMRPKPTRPSVAPASRFMGGAALSRYSPALVRALKKATFRAGQDESQRMVRHFRHAIIGDIADGNVQFGRRFDADVVQADAEPGDEPAPRRGPDHAFGDVGPAGPDRIRVAGQFDQRRLIALRRFDDFGPDPAENAAFDGTIGPSPVGDEDAELSAHDRPAFGAIALSHFLGRQLSWASTLLGVNIAGRQRCWAASCDIRMAGSTTRSQFSRRYSGGPPLEATYSAASTVGTISMASQGQTVSS